MINKIRSKLTYANVAATAALVLGLGGFAIASIPNANGVITGCYAKTGELRVIDEEDGQTCGDDTLLRWNQQGPQGVQGPQGKPGRDGTNGADGAPGRSAGPAYHVLRTSDVRPARGPRFTVVASRRLPAGNYLFQGVVHLYSAVGGGYARCFYLDPRGRAGGIEQLMGGQEAMPVIGKTELGRAAEVELACQIDAGAPRDMQLVVRRADFYAVHVSGIR